MRNLEENNGVDPRATINMDGAALYEAVAVILIVFSMYFDCIL